MSTMFSDTVYRIAGILDAKNADDILLLHVGEKTIVADYFIIASGTSNTHVKSLADDVEYEISQLNVRPDHVEGRATGWILLDYGTVIVHLFTGESREYYNLERLWSDAQQMDLSEITTEA